MATEWQTVTVADVSTLVTKGTTPTLLDGGFVERGVKFIKVESITADGRIDFERVSHIDEATNARLARSTLKEDDILFTIAGTIGRVAMVSSEILPANTNQAVAIVRVNTAVAHPRFLYYVLGDETRVRQAHSRVVQSVQANFSLTEIRSLEIPIPSLFEQCSIADVLKSLDDKIEQNRRTAQSLERLAQAIFRAWFVDFEPVKAKAAGATAFPSMPQSVFDALPTRFVDSGIGPVPEGWGVRPIGDVVTAKGGGTPSTKNTKYWEGGKHYWATPKDMSRLAHPVLLDTERTITDEGVDAINSGVLPVGTVLLSSRAPVGYLAIAGVPTAINQGFIAMVCDGPLPSTYVLNWAFACMDAIKGRASGTTFPEISKKNFRPLPVLVPTPDVVAAFRQLVDPLFDLLTACIKESNQLATMRDYLLPKLLDGSVRAEAARG